jgi:hypothetical protein
MKILLILGLLVLTGCTTAVPVKRVFPEAPQVLLTPCPEQLKTLDKGVQLSDVAKVVTENYSQYHECGVKVKAWIGWYQAQKRIFEEVK